MIVSKDNIWTRNYHPVSRFSKYILPMNIHLSSKFVQNLRNNKKIRTWDLIVSRDAMAKLKLNPTCWGVWNLTPKWLSNSVDEFHWWHSPSASILPSPQSKSQKPCRYGLVIPGSWIDLSQDHGWVIPGSWIGYPRIMDWLSQDHGLVILLNPC